MKNRSSLSDTDLCVMCGMCLPQCPTYQLYQNEAESPRGRISLMHAINNGKLEPGEKAIMHIDHCLGCLNCQTICPSKVPFGNIIDEFRTQYTEAIKKPVASRAILRLAAKTNGLNKYFYAAQLPAAKPLLKILSRFIRLPAMSGVNKYKKLDSYYSCQSPAALGDVSLFSGCTGKTIDSTTLFDAAYLLTHLGFNVHIPQQTDCCGALHQHNGQTLLAETLLTRLSDTEKTAQNKYPLLFFTPSCGTQLIKNSALNAQDARAFILFHASQQKSRFNPVTSPVALHESCGHRNSSRLTDINRQLLTLIPQIEIIESSEPALCCGAGGIQNINYPQQAEKLSARKAQSFNLSRTSLLVSDNIGCSIHMKSALTRYNKQVEVIHPISLLARSLAVNADRQ